MSLKYCCFISYRRRKEEKKLAELLAEKLREELASLMAGSTPVFRDDDYVNAGDATVQASLQHTAQVFPPNPVRR